MFGVLKDVGLGRILIDRFGDIVEYQSKEAGSIFKIGLIDKNVFVQDPAGKGGFSLQTPKTMGYMHVDDVANCYDGDKMIYKGETFKVKAPRLGDDGLWEFALEQEFDDE